MKKRIKYICYYDNEGSKVLRNYTVSATNKMDYIISSLNRNDIGVDLVSFSHCKEDRWAFSSKHKTELGNNTLQLFTSFGPYNVSFIRLFSRYLMTLEFVLWFLFNVRKGEELIVYHSLGYCRLLTLLKKIKKCRYIGEIEEIYQDVSPMKKSVCVNEYKFFNECDKYIFPTILLNNKLNEDNKPYLLVHGIYEVGTARNVSFHNDKVNVVYAGTFDPNKGGVFAAIGSAEFLDESFHVHIIGFGSEKDTENVIESIKRIQDKSKSVITYDGFLTGEAYIQFLQKCQIGLSTQNPKGIYNDTSYPSKILSYMSNGLKVVSVKIPAITTSAVGQYLYYYEKQEPQAIAHAIMVASNDLNAVDSRDVLKELDKTFIAEISKFCDLQNI